MQSVDISFNIWSILILFGAFHGYLLTFYFLFVKRKTKQYFFGLLILIISLHLTEYALTISQLHFKFPNIIAITFPALFLMGPLYYLHCRKLFGHKITLKSLLHAVPAILALFFMLPFYIMKGSEKLNSFVISVDLENPQFSFEQFLVIFLHFLHMAIYAFISWKLIRQEIQGFKQKSSDNSIEKVEQLKKSTYVFSAFLGLFLVMLTLMFLIKKYSIEFDYIIVLALSGIIYFIGYVTLRQPVIRKTKNDQATKYATSSLSTKDKEILQHKLDTLIDYEKPYVNSELKISDLAEKLDVPVHHLSQVINQEYGSNFFDFINRFRVENAKSMLLDENYSGEKILAIAIDSGFNNKASFNRVFKKHTGLSPSQFRIDIK